MVPFKPAEIKIIAVLSVLAIAGSIVTILQRQGRLSRLDVGVLTEKSGYNYSYNLKELQLSASSDSIDRMEALAAVQEAKAPGEKIDLNHDGIFDLQTLPGIGPVLAERIAAYRDSAGGFHSIDDLRKVKGIGPAKFAEIKDKVIIR
jgi:competence ComEA-like helix-hairpin-helix protein